MSPIKPRAVTRLSLAYLLVLLIIIGNLHSFLSIFLGSDIDLTFLMIFGACVEEKNWGMEKYKCAMS